MKRLSPESGLVSVHTLRDTSPEKHAAMLDHGRFVDDLSKRGLGVVLTNRNTFTEGKAIIPKAENDTISFTSTDIEPQDIEAMHVRPLASIKVAGSEAIPKLNANNLKQLAGSKIDLYRQVLANHQVPTYFVDMQPEGFNDIAEVIASIATKRVVLKRNSGAGGASTRIMEKAEALAWVSDQIDKGEAKPHILQPEIMFGKLPADIRAAREEDQALIDRAREEGLLCELRSFVVKRRNKYDVVPLLRVVPDKTKTMQGDNDVYIDITVGDELMEAISETTTTVTHNAAEAAGGISFVAGTVDYYFDENSLPRVMEANYRSTELPVTRENPIAGRAAHKAVADALAEMTNQVK